MRRLQIKKILTIALAGALLFSNVSPTVYAINDESNRGISLLENDVKTLEIHGSGIENSDLRKFINNELNGNTGYTYRYSTDKNTWTEIKVLSSNVYKIKNDTYYVQHGYYNFRNGSYVWTDLGTMKVRNYYNITFNVTNLEGAGVKINNNPVTEAKAYTDQENIKFTVNQVENYTVEVKVDGNELTPTTNGEYTLPTSTLTTDKEITVEYKKITGAIINVTQPDNGDIKINGNKTTSTRVPENETYTITVEPKEGYAVEKIFVDGNEQTISYDENHVATAQSTAGADDSVSTVSAELVKVEIKTKGNEINKFQTSVEDITDNIFALIDTENSVPAGMTKDDITIKYNAGISWEEIGFQPTVGILNHAFGKDTETIRITYKGTDKYPSVTKEFTIKLVDNREETTLTVNEGIKIKYKDDDAMASEIKTLIGQNAVVKDKEGNTIQTTEDDFEYTPATDKWNAGQQTITVKYKGTNEYKSSEKELVITIEKGDATLKVNSQNITYGEEIQTVFSSTPTKAKPVGLIVGIEGNGKSYVALDLNGIVDLTQLENVPFIGNDIKDFLDNGVNVGKLVSVLNTIADYGFIDSSVADAIAKVIETINSIPNVNINDLTVHLTYPKETGIYLAVGATTNSNYKTAIGVGYLTIKPASENVSLKFNAELPENNKLTYKDAQDFNFGGKLYNGTEEKEGAVAKYAKIDKDGIKTSDTPYTEPGTYLEVVYEKNSNLTAAPIFRFYTVDKVATHIVFDDNNNQYSPTYNGQPHGIKAYVYDEYNNKIADATITYFVNRTATSDAPVNVGTYNVNASYDGDTKYKKATIITKQIIIGKKVVTITANDKEMTYGDELPTLTYTVVGNDLNDNLGTITVKKANTANRANTSNDVGEYDLIVEVENKNSNYNYTLYNGKLTIKEKEVFVTVDDKEVTYGDNLPTYTYTVTDKDNNKLSNDEIATLGTIKVTKDKTEVDAGEYDLIASITNANSNYKFEFNKGLLTILKRKVEVNIDSKKKEVGKEDPELTYTVNNLVDGDELGITLSRESGEEVGLYDIYVNVENLNNNYEFTTMPDGKDKFEIVEKVVIAPDNKDDNTDKPSVTPSNKEDKSDKEEVKSDKTKTGDDTNTMLYVELATLALLGCIILFLQNKKSSLFNK